MVSNFYKDPNFHVSKVILSLFLLTHIVFYFVDKEITFYFALNPQRVINDIEIWRLFTYPILSLSIAEVVLFLFAFWLIAPKIEYYILSKSILVLSFVVYIPLQGILSTLLFARENVYMVGTEGLSFAVITLYFLIFYRIVYQYQDVSLRLLIQTALVVFFWIMAASLDAYIYQRPTLINSFGFAVSGVILGIISYYFAKPIVKELMEIRIDEYKRFRQVFLEPIEKYQSEIGNSNSNNNEVDDLISLELGNQDQPSEISEERLNKILDKMNEQGKDSLTIEEIKFLENYSRFLNDYLKK